jgi:hypothetical protein
MERAKAQATIECRTLDKLLPDLQPAMAQVLTCMSVQGISILLVGAYDLLKCDG